MDDNTATSARTAADPEWVTTSEAADFLGVSARTMERLADERRIPHYRMRSRLRFSRADLEAYRDSCRVDAVSA